MMVTFDKNYMLQVWHKCSLCTALSDIHTLWKFLWSAYVTYSYTLKDKGKAFEIVWSMVNSWWHWQPTNILAKFCRYIKCAFPLDLIHALVQNTRIFWTTFSVKTARSYMIGFCHNHNQTMFVSRIKEEVWLYKIFIVMLVSILYITSCIIYSSLLNTWCFLISGLDYYSLLNAMFWLTITIMIWGKKCYVAVIACIYCVLQLL